MSVRRITVFIVAGACLLPAGAAAASADRVPATRQTRTLPLGDPTLAETRERSQVAAGVTLTTITRGRPSEADFWTVTAGFFATASEAQALAARLTAAGFPPRVEQVDGRSEDDPQDGPVGFVVRTGRGGTEAELNAVRTRLIAAGFAGTSVTNTSLDGGSTTGPWVIRVLDVAPQARARVQAQLGTDVVPELETTSSIARRTGALAGINGGYFVIPATDGTPGDLAGISVRDGRLLSEAVNGRAALVLRGGGRADVQRLRTSLSVLSSNGGIRVLNGRNRKPGLIRSCGVPGATPTVLAKHDVTCTGPDELVQLDDAFGVAADAGAGEQATLDARGRVVARQGSRGGAIPAGGSVLQGIGAGAQWITQQAAVGATMTVRTAIYDEQHRLVEPGRQTDVVNGGPLLVRNSRPYVDAAAEGFVQPDRPAFYYGFAVRRNPRTMAGVTRQGHLLLVTADGRQPGYSVGLSFPEQAAVMTSLGARDALNLDGGGSTTMVGPGGTVLGRPSDTTGERPVGDALLIYPRR